MPKKKRKMADKLDPQGQNQEEEEDSRKLSDINLKSSFVDACIVISDSDGEQESKEEHSLQKKRTKQKLDRAKFAAKRKIAQMTEDEQFALALKMSEQEAMQLNSQEEEEEELLRKAIAESLSSCQLPESSAAAAVPFLSPAPGSPAQSHPAEQEDTEPLAAMPPCTHSLCSGCSSLSPSNPDDENGQADVAKRPFVVLTRLSQEIVESSQVSSIIVSPGKSQPFARSNENSSSPAGSSSSDTLLTQGDDMPLTLSPTFPQKPSGVWPLVPQRLFSGRCNNLSKPTNEPFQTCSERDPLAGCSQAVEKVPQEPSILDHLNHQDSHLEYQFGPSKKTFLSSELESKNTPVYSLHMTDKESPKEEKDTVHYYWGVPFCPKGIDPNKYTQVILCQLEVYQKSLKQAQRQLLQKKAFGEPVVPNSCSLRQSEHGKEEELFRRRESTDEQEGGDADERKEPERAVWLRSSTNGEINKKTEENVRQARNSDSDDQPTSGSSQASQVLFAEDVLEEREPMQITQSISALTPLDSKRSPDISTENRAEEEITVCPETQPSPSQAIEPESREIHSSSKDVSLQADAEEDVAESKSVQTPPSEDPMSCPLCDRRFPISEIELHAMNCNGPGGDANEDAPVMTRQRREAKSKTAILKETPKSLDIDKCEKCYICKSLVPWKAYQRHVDGCLQSQNTSGAQEGRTRLRRGKKEGRSEGRLLNMLEESEHKAADGQTALDAEAPDTPPKGEDLSMAETDDGAECSRSIWTSFPQAACGDSPIKSFTSISEAKDCLVDFKKQLAIGSGSRKQTKTSLRSKKKF
ncbi:BRCA1-A complex subunit RAP80 isoform X1 [Anolis sagrei]|uniref:BRCA1-A complex subunit RAP80 isoform X1 n=2 Tax=Anolis sagrei TaxID=38937 RepID=UPI003521B813